MNLTKHEVALWPIEGEPDFTYPFYSFILRHSARVLEEDKLAGQMAAWVEATQRRAKHEGLSIGEVRTTERGDAIELDEPYRGALAQGFGVPDLPLSDVS